MIAYCDIYVIGKGFTPIYDISPGDEVYTLNDLTPEICRVDSITSEFSKKPLSVIEAGMNFVETTDDTRFLYLSENHGIKWAKFKEIETITPNKEYRADKFLPVASMPFLAGRRNTSDQQIEYIVRTLAVEKLAFDYDEFISTTSQFTGEDAMVFIDLIEHWISDTPGTGAFGKLNRKTRAYFFKDRRVANEVCRVACLAGMCTMVTHEGFTTVILIYSDGVFTPGDRPKTELYKKKLFRGNIYNINAKNRPIFGRMNSRAYYLPTKSILNEEYNKP